MFLAFPVLARLGGIWQVGVGSANRDAFPPAMCTGMLSRDNGAKDARGLRQHKEIGGCTTHALLQMSF